ncbi:MAG TPA: hypothetical protein P5132_10625 [Bacteroidales bacterium]|nr:hypothetical protein [Bacteroidales bacterium]
MKKVLGLISAVLFVVAITVSVNAQDPQKKNCDTKAKTEKCAETKSKDCTKACDKKAETKNCDTKAKEVKKVEKK